MRHVLALLFCLALASPAHGAKGKFKDDQVIRDLASTFWESWNKHDAKAMVAIFRDDATLINPMGRVANGRAEIEKLLTEEHATYMKESVARGGAVKIQFVGRNVAIIDQEIDLSGAKGFASQDDAPFKLHLSSAVTKKNGKWLVAAARPYSLLPPVEIPIK